MIPGLLLVVFLLLEGFFSGSEIAMVSANRLHLKDRAAKGHKGAILALKMLDRPEFLLGTCLIGTNLCTVGASTVAAGPNSSERGEHSSLPCSSFP